MAKSRSNDPHVRPSVRQPVSQSAKEFLEPADSFDLGDDVSSAEAAAGEWLGRKAAAKSRKKKSLKEKTARGSVAAAETKEPAPARNAPVERGRVGPCRRVVFAWRRCPREFRIGRDMPLRCGLVAAQSSFAQGVSGKASLFGASQSHS